MLGQAEYGAACWPRAGKLQCWTLFYRPCRHALKTDNYLFGLLSPSLVKEGFSGTVPALLGLLPTWAIASVMSHLVEFSNNKYKRHKHRTVRRPHTPWQVTAARTTETSRAAGDEGLSDAQCTLLSECYGMIPATNRKFSVYLAAIWQ